MSFLKLVHKSIFRELATVFAMILTVFLSFLLLGKLLKLRQVLFSLDMSLLDIGSLFVYLSPFFLMLLLPISCMISTFLTFQRMGNDRELMALRSGGVSLPRIVPGVIVFLLLCAGLNLLVALHGVSWGMQRFQSTLVELAKTKTQLALRPGLFYDKIPGITIFAKDVDSVSGGLSGIFVKDETRQEAEVSIVAPKGRISSDPEQGKILFSLNDGRIYRQADSGSMDILSFSNYRIVLDLKSIFGDMDVDTDKPKYMAWSRLQELEASREVRQQAGISRTEVQVEQHKRFALPAACLVLGFFALPLGWILDEVKRQYGGLLILGMFFVYYALFYLGLSFGQTGAMPVWLGVWMPNGVFLVLGSLAMYRAMTEGRGRLLYGVAHLRGIGESSET
jgi:lipopolysaccharide export system permease protein